MIFFVDPSNQNGDIERGHIADLNWNISNIFWGESQMFNGAGIFTYIKKTQKSSSFVGKYSSTMVRIWECTALSADDSDTKMPKALLKINASN